MTEVLAGGAAPAAWVADGSRAGALRNWGRAFREREGTARFKNWFDTVVSSYLRYHYARRTRPSEAVSDEATERLRAEAVIRRACYSSALSGAASGLVSTGASMMVAETEGWASLLAVPAGLAAVAAEMIFRAVGHMQLACDLADIFETPFDPDHPKEVWRVLALAFKARGTGDEQDEVSRIESLAGKEARPIGESISKKLAGETVMRNLLPFASVITSAWANWRLARHLGDFLRHYFRYRRALRDAFARDEALLGEHRELLLQGVWLIFGADGRLNDEEAAVFGRYLDKTQGAMKDQVVGSLSDDKQAWLDRLPALPEERRDAFIHALFVAAAVDKVVSPTEEELLRDAAQALGRSFDRGLLDRMIDELERVGVLAYDDARPSA